MQERNPGLFMYVPYICVIWFFVRQMTQNQIVVI